MRLDDFTVHLLAIRRKFICETGVNRYLRKYVKCTAAFAYIVQHSRGQKEVTYHFFFFLVSVSGYFLFDCSPIFWESTFGFSVIRFCVKRDKCVALYFPKDPAVPSFLQLWVKISCSPVVLIHPVTVRGPFSSHRNF